MTEFSPTNELEKTLVAAMSGLLSEAALMDSFLASDVVVLLNQPPSDDGRLTSPPLGFRMSDGNDSIAVYTSMCRVPHDIEKHNLALQTKLSWIVSTMNADVGIVCNP